MPEIKRYITYDNATDDPLLVLEPKTQRDANREVRFAIRIQDAWAYSEDHNPFFEQHMLQVCAQVYELFDLGFLVLSDYRKIQRMSELATVIQEGIEDLLKTPPRKFDGQRVVGEARVVYANLDGSDGVEFDSPLVEDVLIPEEEERIH